MRLGGSRRRRSARSFAPERRLGVALFNRTTQAVSAFTEAGLGFLGQGTTAVSALTAAALEVGDSSGSPSGLLRLNASRAAYMTVLQPVLAAFLQVHPQIDPELTMENAPGGHRAPGL